MKLNPKGRDGRGDGQWCLEGSESTALEEDTALVLHCFFFKVLAFLVALVTESSAQFRPSEALHTCNDLL